MKKFSDILIKNFSKKDSSDSKIIPFFGIAGIFIGVFSIIFVISIMRGFQSQLIDRLIGTQPHVYISSTQNNFAFDDWKILKEKLLNDVNVKILKISPYIEAESIAISNNVTMGNVIFAVDNEYLKTIFSREKDFEFLKEREIYVGNQFALTNNVREDDELMFISAWDLIGSSTRMPEQRKFFVKGTLKTGSYPRDLKYVYMRIEDAVKYFSPKKGVPNGLVVLLNNPATAKNFKEYLLNNYKNIKVETWQDRNEKLFYSLKIERMAMLFTLIFIIIVASFSIISSLVLFVESRSTDFAILFSMGFSKKTAVKMLFRMSFIKGVKGAVSGGLLAWLLTFLIKKYEFITLPEIYYDTYLPVKIDPVMNVLVIVLSIVVCVLGAAYPIQKMKKISITKLLRKN